METSLPKPEPDTKSKLQARSGFSSFRSFGGGNRARAVMLMTLLAVSLSTFIKPAGATSREPNTEASPVRAYYGCTYIVRAGDDLFRIGLLYQVPWWELAVSNGIPNAHLIFTGMALRVPCYGPVNPPAPSICSIHIVQRGEWLALIAASFGVSWESVAAANWLRNPNLIYPGQRLLIPCGWQTPVPTITRTPMPTFTPTPVPTVPVGVSVNLTSTSPYTGTCPANAFFSGTITASADTIVTWVMERSDGLVLGPVIARAGIAPMPIADRWPSTPLGTVWERVHVLQPSSVVSPLAYFTNNCVAQTSITFGTLPDGTPITADRFLTGNEYESLGVTFAGAPESSYCSDATVTAIRSPGTYGGTNFYFLTTARPGIINQCNSIPVAIRFTSPVRLVSLSFAGASVEYTFNVYDSRGTLLQRVPVQGNYGSTVSLTYVSAITDISRVTFGYETGMTAIKQIVYQR